jgi:phosphatidylglycerophosphate synthase
MTISNFTTAEGPARRSINIAVAPVVGVGACLMLSIAWLDARSALLAFSIYGIVAAIVVARVKPFHPRRNFGAANTVTLARSAMVALMAGLAATPGGMQGSSVVLFGLAVAVLGLDGLDGWLARRRETVSAFGARFDMEIDALFILVLCATAILAGKVGPWVLAIGLMRYAFIAAGMMVPALTAPLPASQRRKFVCVGQIVILSALMLPAVQPPWSLPLAMAALLCLAASFLADTVWLLRVKRA